MQENPHSLTKAVFVGSFDPFHEGHASIVRRAQTLFDKLVIGIGVNPEKTYMFSTEERKKMIESKFPEIEVETYEGLTIDFCKKHNATYIIKGVRNEKDFLYEQQQARWNKEHGNVETVLLFAEPELEELSSTKIRNGYI